MHQDSSFYSPRSTSRKMLVIMSNILAFLALGSYVNALSAINPSTVNNKISRRSVLATPAAALAFPVLQSPKLSRAIDDDGSKIITKNSLIGGDRVQLAGQTSSKHEFPLASFGLQIYDDNTAYKLTLTAIEVGYRNFFASVLAGNQKGFARAVRDSGVSRDELFIVGTVLSNKAKGDAAAYKKTKQGWRM